MTETEKTFKSILSSYKPHQKKKKIVTESVQIKNETIKNEAKKNAKEKEDTKVETELDDVEQTFISKFIEYSELSLLNQSAEELTATFEKSLGVNAQVAIKQLMNKITQRENRIKELAKQLTNIKEQMIKETEKARAKETLITLASKISIPTDKTKSKSQTDKTTNKPVNIDNPAAFADVASTINVVESKKKSKKK